MTSEAVALFDPGALVIVLAGTALATLARCGWRDVLTAAKALFHLALPAFDEDSNRAALARSAPEIRQRGHLCANAPAPPDRSIAKLVDAYLKSGSLEALHSAARAERSHREIKRAQAVRVFDYAGELAPIFGLVGTLLAISQLSPVEGVSATETAMGAVATAVLSSLYGVLTAHLVCVPLAGVIERRSLREEDARGALLDWFEGELSGQRAGKLSAIKDAA